MNVLRINELSELRIQGLKESLKSTNEDMIVYALAKNGSNTYVITTDCEKVVTLIKKENFSLYGRYLGGLEIPVDSFNVDSLQESVNFEWFSRVGCYKLDKLQQVDFLYENCGYNYDSAWMLVYGE